MASPLLSQLMLSLVPPMPADTSHVVETSSGGSHLPSLAASQPSVILHLGVGTEGGRNKCLSPFKASLIQKTLPFDLHMGAGEGKFQLKLLSAQSTMLDSVNWNFSCHRLLCESGQAPHVVITLGYRDKGSCGPADTGLPFS